MNSDEKTELPDSSGKDTKIRSTAGENSHFNMLYRNIFSVNQV